MGELAYAVLRRQLAVLRDKEPGTRLGEDPEELHDMRVATRRLRAALALFADVLPVRAQVFREELGWLGRLLGRGARPRRPARGSGRHGRQRPPAGAPALRADDHDPLAELAALLEREREAARARDAERPRLGALGAPGQGPGRHGPAGAGAPLRGRPGPGRDRHARAGRGPPRRGGQGGEAGQEVRAWSPTSTACASAASGCATRSSSAPRSTAAAPARFVRQLTALQDELGLHAGRRGGRRCGWPTWPPARSTCRPPPSS